ncbi:MAG: hypothetical protein KA523_04525 [Flavobacterium sp.]|jgi:hypothetical protein|nr:hypothetical protein [Flavobacterium sp.]
MELFDSTKSIVENLYLLSGPLILISIIIGIYQIKISQNSLNQSKKDLFINSKRDSIKLALEQDKYILEKITPIEIELINYRKEKKYKMEFYKKPILFTKKELDNYGKDKLNNYIKVTDMGNTDMLTKMITIIHNLNCVAVHYNSKIADDETGFITSGQYFCNVVEAYYPIIAIRRQNNNDVRYKDIKELYSRWSKKLESNQISSEIEELTKIKSEIQTITLTPLGTTD